MDREAEGYLSFREAAGRYGVAYSTLTYWMRGGKLPAYKFPRERLVYLKIGELEPLLRDETPRPGAVGRWRRP